MAPWLRTAQGAGLLGADGSVAASIFAEMSGLAVRHNAINLGQGFPDEDGSDLVLKAAQDAIGLGYNQYPPGRGVPVLLDAVAAHQERWYGLHYDPATEVLVTAGATEALAASLLAFVRPGDEVVVLEPYYDAYAGLVALAGGTLVPVPLRWPDFTPDEATLRAAVTDRTRVILVNNPHNPTGAMLHEQARSLIVELATQHDAIILADEVYEHLTFGVQHVPFATVPGARERTISVSSAGKTFAVTGWKIGWITAPAELVTAVLTVKQFLTYVNGGPFQPAVAAGLGLSDAYYYEAAATLQSKRDLLVAGLEHAGLTVAVPSATYFVVADAAPLGATDAVEFCRSLPEEVGVAAIPVTAFVRESEKEHYRTLVRFAFCKRTDVIAAAVERLATLRK